jgi:hypothetical protein
MRHFLKMIFVLQIRKNLCLQSLRTLGKVRTSGIERGTLSAFEDLLSAMVRGSAGLVTLLKEDGIITVCQVRPFGY